MVEQMENQLDATWERYAGVLKGKWEFPRSSHYKPEEAHSKDAGEPKFTWRKIRFGEALPHGQGQVCSAESLHVT